MKARSLLLSKSLRPRIKSIAASSTVTSPSDGESGSIAVAAVAAAALALSTAERKRERQWCHPSAASAFAAAGSLILSSSVRCESLGQEDIIGSSSGVRTIVPEPTDDKSISAHRTAAEHDLFRDELISAGMVENNSINERFVSVSPYAAPAPPIRHRVSVRHAHRLTEDDDDEEEKLLATSSEDIPAPAKNYNTTLGAVAEITEKDMAAAADSLAGLRPDRKDALLRRIKTCSSDHEDQVYTKKMVRMDSMRNCNRNALLTYITFNALLHLAVHLQTQNQHETERPRQIPLVGLPTPPSNVPVAAAEVCVHGG